MKKSFFQRIKNIENSSNSFLNKEIPIICKLKLHNFQKLRKITGEPTNEKLNNIMINTALNITRELNNVLLCYTQGSEISILLSDFKNKKSNFFDYNVQRICSFIASKSSILFHMCCSFEEVDIDDCYEAFFFTCNCFNISFEEVTNYFILQQRNSIHDSTHYWHDYYLPSEAKQKHSNEKISFDTSLLPSYDKECNDLHFKFGTLITKEKVKINIKNLPREALEFYEKYDILIEENNKKEQWFPRILDIKIEENKNIIENKLK